MADFPGTSGKDTLDGSVNDDTLTGYEDNDTLNGGGGIDTAVFSGPRINYTITPTGIGSYTVIDIVGSDGTDTLNSIERVKFSDGTIPLLGVLLSDLNGSNGFAMIPVSFDDDFGNYVRNAGDINGDTYDDLIIGSSQADNNGNDSGSSYIVFGKASGFPATFNLATLNGSNGFRLDGVLADHELGTSVSGAGDVNGDGFDDLIVGAPVAATNGSGSGASYVIFGKASGFAATFDLTTLDGSNGFRIDGESIFDVSGRSVSNAGDVNGDGFGDILVGAALADPVNFDAGSSYVIFGKANGFDATFNLGSVNGSNGFRIDSGFNDAKAGYIVSSAGDINGDGFDDVIIGSQNFNAAAYLVFGKAGGFAATLSLNSLDGSNGFRMISGGADDGFGESLSAAGDINGDGFDDLIVGAFRAGPNGNASGSSYVMFGKADGYTAKINVTGLNYTEGFRLDGAAMFDQSGFSVSGAGDVNSDGYDDLIIGANRTNLNGNDSGSSYVVFGRPSGFTTLFNLSDMNERSGFRLDGAAGDRAGQSVSRAGDINSDGFDDLIIGAPDAGNNGKAFVVFGKSSGPLNHEPGGDVVIDPAAKEGEAIVVSHSLTDADGLGTITYQWYANGIALIGSSNDTYTPTEAEIGKRITVVASFIDGQGTKENIYSNASAPVIGIKPIYKLAILNGENGFRIDGRAAFDFLGISVSAAGDVNGDGFDDFVIGAYGTDINGNSSGSSYVIYGKAEKYTTNFDLADLDGSNGFRLDGVAANDQSGLFVSGAGDVNGDGFDDLIIGAPAADPMGSGSGSSYVVFGMADGFAPAINLASLDGMTGFRIDGALEGDASGRSVRNAGDVNGDGYDDLIVGAYWADPNGSRSGSSYVIFGKPDNFSATFSLASVNGINGFRLDGSNDSDLAGRTVSGAGDINGDGYDDILIAAPATDYNGDLSGSSYVVFGKSGGFSATMNLASLDGSNGFRIDGLLASTSFGTYVSALGDINGDGLDDIIIGASSADFTGDSSGSSYVVFGKLNGYTATLDLASLNGSNGFRLDGVAAGDNTGYVVSGAGDVNGDGLQDLIVGAYQADPSGSNSGKTYVVYGRSSGYAATINLDTLDYDTGFRLDGENVDDRSGEAVSSAGDINGDGIDDLLIGAPVTDNNGINSGSVYVLYGKSGGFLNNTATGSVDISGTAIEGATLTVTNTLADADGLGTITYQWKANGVAISGATSNQLLLGQSLVGKTISVTASYIDGLGANESVTSNATTNVVNVNDPPAGSVTISGNAVEGQTLTASNSLTDEDGLGAIGYQWYAGGVLIPGASSSVYTLTANQVGKTLTVIASYTDGQGTPESVASNATSTVQGLSNGELFTGTPGNDVLTAGNGNDTLRGFDGNDTLEGLAGNDLIEGGNGLDHALFHGNIVQFSVLKTQNNITVTGPANSGTDTLTDTERLRFDDMSLAFDLDGNAGTIAKLLGVVLGKDDWYNREYMGVGLDIVDNEPIDKATLMGLAFGVILGPNPSNTAVVNLIYNNLVGQAPSPQELAALTADLLDSGAFTQGTLGVLALDHEFNLANIDLVGLTQVGVEYLAIG